MGDLARKEIIEQYKKEYGKPPCIALLQFFLSLRKGVYEETGQCRLWLDGSYNMTQYILDTMKSLGWQHSWVSNSRGEDGCWNWNDTTHNFYRLD